MAAAANAAAALVLDEAGSCKLLAPTTLPP
jgi:hypothetical protein